MKGIKWIFILIILVVVLTTAACKPESGDLNDAIATGVAATQTKQAWEADMESIRQTDAAAEPSVTPEPDIVHITYPSYSEGSNTFVSDFSSLDYAPEKSTVGDYYQMNRLERPFSADEMDYFGDLDITRVELKFASPWFYATFMLTGDLREAGDIYYGLEFDLDSDGRGDFLIWALLPSGLDWVTDGVQVLEDRNNDVGGLVPLQMEDPNTNLDGYETVIFNAGEGDDPDLAWIRRDPEVTSQIQIAFKDSFLGSEGFLWSAWADEGLIDPGLFDYNDQVVLPVAGSPYKDSPEYPLKAVPLVDSTCRSWYGMVPEGDEPGLCTIQQEKTPNGGPKRGWCVPHVQLTHGGQSLVCLGPCLVECSGRFCIPCTIQ